jgi:hypothetical protein
MRAFRLLCAEQTSTEIANPFEPSFVVPSRILPPAAAPLLHEQPGDQCRLHDQRENCRDDGRAIAVLQASASNRMCVPGGYALADAQRCSSRQST